MNKDKEKYKRTALIVDALVLLTWETSTFGIIWLNYYNSEMAFSFFRKGNWLLFGLYFAILYVFSRIYKGLDSPSPCPLGFLPLAPSFLTHTHTPSGCWLNSNNRLNIVYSVNAGTLNATRPQVSTYISG